MFFIKKASSLLTGWCQTRKWFLNADQGLLRGRQLPAGGADDAPALDRVRAPRLLLTRPAHSARQGDNWRLHKNHTCATSKTATSGPWRYLESPGFLAALDMEPLDFARWAEIAVFSPAELTGFMARGAAMNERFKKLRSAGPGCGGSCRVMTLLDTPQAKSALPTRSLV